MDQIPATTAMATASMMQTATVCATSLKSQDARTQQLVTTTLTQPTTTALASSSTSAAYAAVTASPTAPATVMATYWMSVVCVMVTALPTAHATVMGRRLRLRWQLPADDGDGVCDGFECRMYRRHGLQRLRTTTAAAITARVLKRRDRRLRRSLQLPHECQHDGDGNDLDVCFYNSEFGSTVAPRDVLPADGIDSRTGDEVATARALRRGSCLCCRCDWTEHCHGRRVCIGDGTPNGVCRRVLFMQVNWKTVNAQIFVNGDGGTTATGD